MDRGEIIETNSPDQFFSDPQNERTKAFLGQILQTVIELVASADEPSVRCHGDDMQHDVPQAYKVVRDGRAVETSALMPDGAAGMLDRDMNRVLFYSGEDKIKFRLSTLFADFDAKQLGT